MSGAFDAGSVSAALKLDLNDWSANIEKAKADSKSLAGVVASKKDDIEKFGKAFTAAGVAIVGALGLAIKSAMDFTLEAGRMADKTGIAVETISGLREAADDAEVTMSDLSGGFRRYSAVVADAAGGNKMAQDSLKKLGIEIFDSSGKLKTMDQLLLDAADRFSKMENGTEKAALAQDLFGRGGAALIPLLNKGADGIRAYTEDVRKSGQMITQEGVEKARAFRIGLDNLDDAVMAVKLSIAQALMPVVKTLAGAFTFLVGGARDVLNIFPPLGSAVTVVVGTFGALAAVIGPVLLMLPKLLDIKMKIAAALPVLNARLMTVGATVKSLSLTFFAVVLAAEAVSFAFKKLHESQDRAIGGIMKSAEETGKAWKFAQASIKGGTDVSAEEMKKFIANQRALGRSAEEIGQKIYEMYKTKIGASIKAVAKDTAEVADKIKEVQRELTDKIKEMTLNEFDFRIYQAARWRDDMKEKVKGSVDEARLAAEAEKAYAFEVAKVRKEQAAAAAEAEVKSLDALYKRMGQMLLPVKGLFGKLSMTMEMAFKDAGQSAKTVFANMEKAGAGAVNNIVLDMNGFKTGTKKTFSEVASSLNQTLQIMQQGAGQFFSGLSQLSQQRFDREKKQMNDEYEAKKKQIENSLMTEAEKNAALTALDEEYALKKKTLEIKQAESNKKSGIAQALVNTAIAVTSALSMKPFFPLGLIAAAMAAAAGYIQVRIIQNTPIPQLAEGGVAMKPTIAQIGEAGPEAVIPLREWARMMGIKKSGMGGSTNYYFTAQAFDATGMDRVFSRSIIPRMKRSLARESLTVAPNAVRY